MSKISEIIFKGEKHYITSKFGSRTPIKTSAGTTSNVHKGTDYGTNGKKIPQYAIEDGTIYSCGTDSSGAKYVSITYPRLNVRMYHGHLDTISVKKGQEVSKYTKIGTTGKTGRATGVHLHLGIIDLKTNKYVDPEVYAKKYVEPKEESKTPSKTSLKYSKNDKIVLNGYLYKTSTGSGRGAKKTNYKGTITIVNEKGSKPYHIDRLGWVAESDIKEQTAISYYKKYTGTSSSIVTALNTIGVNSSFSYRSKIAAKNNITSYKGTASQNTKMVKLLKQGKLIKV